jgi:hypothetical protein
MTDALYLVDANHKLDCNPVASIKNLSVQSYFRVVLLLGRTIGMLLVLAFRNFITDISNKHGI